MKSLRFVQDPGSGDWILSPRPPPALLWEEAGNPEENKPFLGLGWSGLALWVFVAALRDPKEDVTEWAAGLQQEREAARRSDAGAGGQVESSPGQHWAASGGTLSCPRRWLKGGEACLPPSVTEEETEARRGLVTCLRAPRNDPPF